MADNKENNQQRPQTKKKTLRPTSVASSILSSDGFDANCSILNQAQQNNKQHKLKQRFTVIRKLGKGTYGKVQLAINKETGQEVAIKTIKKTKIENEQDLQRVRREIQIMSSIEHPHIIHIYEVFENKDKIVLIMQYAPGGELYEYVSQSKVLDDSEARRLFRQIATAIFYCHQNKICHRDLKLENILLDEKNNAKLADFGLSNVFDKARQLKTFCGSPLYASPEIVQGSPYEGPEVDCWSLGVLLYTLVYGAMPFDGSNFKRLVKQISGASYYEPKQRSQASPLISRLLCADPLKRATIMDICSDPWVNGSMVLSPRLSPTGMQQHSAHTCLLKVAQDMANLTPVRLDILLALTPTTVANKTAGEDGQQKENTVQQGGGDDQLGKRRPTLTPAAAATLMNVDPSDGATSPVASYIVRDLTMKDQPSEQTSEAVPISAVVESSVPQPDERSADSVMAVDTVQAEPSQPEVQHIADSTDVEMELQNDMEQQQNLVEDVSIEDAQVGQETNPDPTETGLESMQVEVQQGTGADESEVRKISADQMDVEAERTTKTDTELVKLVDERVVSDEQMMTVPNESPKEEEQSCAVKIECENEIVCVEDSKERTGEDVAKNELKQAADDSLKAKKKKKIVVVKKKKKLSKKDDESEATRSMTATPVQDLDLGPTQTERDAKQTATTTDQDKNKSEKPGKVKIPDTFKPPSDAQEKVPKVQKVTGRRQSTLIADVSQKLLQQQQQSQNSNQASAVDADQQQLASVRVLDKRSEFERRSSLAESMKTPPKSTSPRGSQALSKMSARSETALDEKTNEIESRQIACKHKIVTSPNDILMQTTIVEPVPKGNLLEVNPPARLIDPSESITPTSYNSDVSTLLPLDTNRLRERMEQLDESGAAQDERSDSVETIKAEIAPQSEERPKNVRSSLIINLNQPVAQSEQEKVPEQHKIMSRANVETPGTSSVGPAPITRSYKKVTFTRDGTCITETGKIYSTQGDDGIVRRIERKSKITHYPDDDSTPACHGQAREEEMHEEVVYESADGHPKRNGNQWKHESFHSASHISTSALGQPSSAQVRHQPLERLIMPFANFIDERDQEMDDCQGSEFSKRQQSPYSSSSHYNGPEMNRADSVSSCSSGSTDIFDDIFDTWTGAISMFNQPRRWKDLHSTLFQQNQFGGSLLFGPRRRSGSSSSSTGHRHHHRPQSSVGRSEPQHFGAQNQQRCGSVEPSSSQWRPFSATGRRHRGAHSQNPGDLPTASGYESDAPFERSTRDRPSSATLASARGRAFGSSNLFPRASPGLFEKIKGADLFEMSTGFEPIGLKLDPFGSDASVLAQEIQLEHERLQKKLAERHKQFWKGSTPSLASAGLPARRETPFFNHAQQDSAQRSSSSSSHQRPPIGPRQSNLQQTSQSSSGSHNNTIHASKPLQAAPTRRNTANLAEHVSSIKQQQQQTVARSTSKTSLSNRLASMRLNDRADFIRLKRTSSSNEMPEQQKQNAALRSVDSKNVNPNSWDSNKTKTPNGSSAIDYTEQAAFKSHGNELPEHPDARIQNWLLDQSATGGNISSVSSGSKSSTSEVTFASNSDNRSHQQHEQHNLQRAESQSTTMTSMTSASMKSKQMQLPSLSRFKLGPLSQQATTMSDSRQQEQRTASSVITLKTSSSHKSLAKQPFELMHESCFSDQSEKHETISTGTAQIGSARHQVTKSVFSFSTASSSTQRRQIGGHQACELGDESKQFKQQSIVTRSSSSSTQQLQQQNVASPQFGQAGAVTEISQPMWTNSSQILDNPLSILGQDDEIDSVLDMESRSSSSLLDQLRSRGYRSMINQRLVSSSSTSTSSSSQQPGVQSHIATSVQTISKQSVSDDVEQQQQQDVRTSHKFASVDTSHSTEDCAGGCLARNGTSPIINGSANDFPSLTTNNVSDLKQQTEGVYQEQQVDGTNHASSGECANARTCNEHNDSASEAGEKSCLQAANGSWQESVSPVCDDEMDEDVREAKASIKSYLDRARETEEFIKSLQKQEESQERQRQQQLFLFNNLLLSTKLNGLPLNSISGSGHAGLPSKLIMGAGNSDQVNFAGPYSAPVQQTTLNCSQVTEQDSVSCFSSDLFRPQATNFVASSIERAPRVDPLEPVQSVRLCDNSTSFGRYPASHSPTRWRRSKSQLADTFYAPSSVGAGPCIEDDQPFASNRRHPFSATVYGGEHKSVASPFFQTQSGGLKHSSAIPNRSRRSMSQVRQHHHHYQPTVSSWFGDSNGEQGSTKWTQAEQQFTSEYKSSFGPNLSVSSAASSSLSSSMAARRRARSPVRRATSPLPKPIVQKLSSNGESDEEDDDKSRFSSSYRARSYAPSLTLSSASCANGSLIGRARDTSPLSPLRRISLTTKSHYSPTRSSHSGARALTPVGRRRSIAGNHSTPTNRSDDEDCARSPQRRRCSERAISSGRLGAAQMENTRLNELEQRIQANKKRREQLLAGNLTDDPPAVAATRLTSRARNEANDNRDEHLVDTDDEDSLAETFGFERPSKVFTRYGAKTQPETDDVMVNSEQSETQQATSSAVTRRIRSSRLESMEARIKRRSYCVRVSSPDRANSMGRLLSGQNGKE